MPNTISKSEGEDQDLFNRECFPTNNIPCTMLQINWATFTVTDDDVELQLMGRNKTEYFLSEIQETGLHFIAPRCIVPYCLFVNMICSSRSKHTNLGLNGPSSASTETVIQLK